MHRGRRGGSFSVSSVKPLFPLCEKKEPRQPAFFLLSQEIPHQIKFMKICYKRFQFAALSLVLLLNSCAAQPANQGQIATASTNQIKASLSPTTRPLSPNFMCFNVNSLWVNSWQNQKVWNAVNQLNPAMLRIPGGTVANYWDWQRGGIIQNESSLPDGIPGEVKGRGRRYTAGQLEDFKAGLESTGKTPMFVLNMLTSTLDSQLQMLQKAQNLGIPVKYIELGNEFYFRIKNYTSVFPTPEDYAKTAQKWTAAIKQKFPDAEVAVIGVAPLGKKDNPRQENWNRSLLNTALSQADAVTFHVYLEPNLTSASNAESYPFFSQEDVPNILSQPFYNWQELQSENSQFRQIPDNKEIWITEYNLMEKVFSPGQQNQKPRVFGSWVHGLFTMTMSLLFLEDRRVSTICNHVLIGPATFGAIFANDKVFRNLSENTSVTPLGLSATGSNLQLLGKATQGMTSAQKIEFSNTPTLRGKENFTYPALYGWLFSNGNNTQAVVINLSQQNLEVDISSVWQKQGSFEQISAPPRTLVTNANSLTRNKGNITKKITLPAYSVTKLSNQP